MQWAFEDALPYEFSALPCIERDECLESLLQDVRPVAFTAGRMNC
jgi:hypothetical protein